MTDRGQIICQLTGREISCVSLNGRGTGIVHSLHFYYAFRRGHYWNIFPEHPDIAAMVHMGVAKKDCSYIEHGILAQ